MKKNWRTPTLIVVLVLLLAIPPLGLILFSIGQMFGEEFSPDDFSSRSFSYNHIPWLNMTIAGIEYEDSTSVLAQELRRDGWIPTTNHSPQRWHLASDLHQPESSRDYDARFLLDFLKLPNVWSTFNQEHPDKAKVFWPAVAHLARNEMYVYVPSVMQLGLSHGEYSLEAFTNELNRLVAKAYVARARIAADAKDWTSVADDTKWALDFLALPDGTELGDLALKNLRESDKQAPVGGDTAADGQQ